MCSCYAFSQWSLCLQNKQTCLRRNATLQILLTLKLQIKGPKQLKLTTWCNEKWDRVLRNYLEECNFQSTEYWCYPDNELDKILCKFWFKVWTTKNKDDSGTHPELYFIASLWNLRNGLSHEMSKHGRHINFTTDPRHRNSQLTFKDACKELKAKGKSLVKSYPEIEHADTVTFLHRINVFFFLLLY